MKLLLFEYKKLLTARTFVIFAAALLVQFGLLFIPSVNKRGYSPEIYKKYLSMLGGEFTEEKYFSIKARNDEIAEIIAVHDETVTAYRNGELSLEAFDEHNFSYAKAVSEQQTVGFLMQKSDYFKAIGGECVYFYDTDWDNFLSGSGFNFIAAFAVIFITIPIFCSEFQSNARSMLFTSLKGTTKLCVCKIIVAVTAAFLAAMSIFLVRFLGFCFLHGDFGDWQIRNIMDHSAYGSLTIRGFYFLDSIIKSAVWAVGAILICAFSCLTQSSLFTVFFSTVLIVCPVLFPVISEGIFSYVFLGTGLSRGYSADLNITLLAAVLLVKSIIYLFIVNAGWRRLK